MTVGSFGDIIFETSDSRILTFTGFKRTVATNYNKHHNIGVKPTLEYDAPDSDSITFTMTLDAQYGVSPRDNVSRMIEMCRDGEAYPLIIGTGAQGLDMWVITQLGAGFDVILNDGGILRASLDITLMEYINDYD